MKSLESFAYVRRSTRCSQFSEGGRSWSRLGSAGDHGLTARQALELAEQPFPDRIVAITSCGGRLGCVTS